MSYFFNYLGKLNTQKFPGKYMIIIGEWLHIFSFCSGLKCIGPIVGEKKQRDQNITRDMEIKNKLTVTRGEGRGG